LTLFFEFTFDFGESTITDAGLDASEIDLATSEEERPSEVRADKHFVKI